MTLFDTVLGACGIAWTGDGICAVQLPMADDEQTRARLARRSRGVLTDDRPAPVAEAIAAVTAALAGEARDLRTIALDLSGVPDFNRSVYAIACDIPYGRTVTYGDIARQLGDVSLSRQVGQALGQNPVPVIVPCHRVLAAGARPGGFSAHGGAVTKLRMLAIEGAYVNHTPSLFDAM